MKDQGDSEEGKPTAPSDHVRKPRASAGFGELGNPCICFVFL